MTENETGFVYEADTPSLAHEVLAVITLTALFFTTLCYIVIIPLLLYYMLIMQSIWLLGLLVVIFTSPYWASGTWHAVGDSFIFHTWRLYFQFRVYKEQVLPQGKHILFTSFPHGLFPLAIPIMSGVCKRVLPELDNSTPIAAVAENMFKAPVISPLLTWLGCVPATEENIRSAIQKETCVLFPDGIAGAFHTDPNEEIIYVRKRTGFIRIAIQQGALLVPFYCFGHTQLFTAYPHRESWLAQWSRRIRFSIIFFAGHSYLPPLPRRFPLLVVIGRAFPVEQCDEPSEEHVQRVLAQYIEEVVSLFNRHKHRVEGWENKILYVY